MTNIKLEEFKKYIKGKKAAVIGVGISNTPLIRWLVSLDCKVTACDKMTDEDPVLKKNIEALSDCSDGIEWSLGESYLTHLREDFYDIVFKTPKMRFETPELAALGEKGSILTTEMELFMNLCPAEIFGITGSDGKTTTSTLTAEILKQAGYKVWLGGNIGTPLLDKVGEIEPSDKVVLELSSFQLLGMNTPVDVAIVTNITPNHLDFHKDYDEYIQAKVNMFRNQGPMGKVVLNAGCDLTYEMKDIARGRVNLFSANKGKVMRTDTPLYPRAYTEDGRLVYEADGEICDICGTDEIFIPGEHNVENFLAASCAVIDYVKPEDIAYVAKNFKGVPHRIEFIRELDGVRWYNSSIDTSPNRSLNTMNALAARREKGVLICGGADKKCLYSKLGDSILKVCDRIIIYGSNGDLVTDIIAKEAKGRKYEIYRIPDKEGDVYEFPETRDNVVNAYKEAIDKARKWAKPGEIVIMSSIGTSYDHFRHFEHRGDMFRDLVNELV
ncbi:MAG: UDP-N-acetylmuramoyl-L-alanine--D-glutamate ligase [Saccharofermentans sp.]|nr:UDP-N-acetylmuramoyl-L-alanine--D-glutamate ligase [Saccharofermentans sp.]